MIRVVVRCKDSDEVVEQRLAILRPMYKLTDTEFDVLVILMQVNAEEITTSDKKEVAKLLDIKNVNQYIKRLKDKKAIYQSSQNQRVYHYAHGLSAKGRSPDIHFTFTNESSTSTSESSQDAIRTRGTDGSPDRSEQA